MHFNMDIYVPQTSFGRHIVFPPFLIIIIILRNVPDKLLTEERKKKKKNNNNNKKWRKHNMSPKRSLGDINIHIKMHKNRIILFLLVRSIVS
jgi:hypothetical protein